MNCVVFISFITGALERMASQLTRRTGVVFWFRAEIFRKGPTRGTMSAERTPCEKLRREEARQRPWEGKN